MMCINIDASVHERYGTADSTFLLCINECLFQWNLNNTVRGVYINVAGNIKFYIQCALPVLSYACILQSDSS